MRGRAASVLERLGVAALPRRWLGLGGGRPAPSPFAAGFQRGCAPALFETAGGEVHAVVATGAHDLLECGGEARARRVDAFADLLAGLRCRFQVVLTSRLAEPGFSGSDRVRRHLDALLARHPAYAREAHLVLSDGPTELDRLLGRTGSGRGQDGEAIGAALVREARAAARGLEAMGLSSRLLEGHVLDRFLDSALPRCVGRGLEAEWEEAPGSLRLDGRAYRSYHLDAYPGVALEAGWLGPLIDLEGEYDLAIHGMRVPASAALRQLNLRIRNLQAARLAESAAHRLDPLAEAGLPEALGLRRDLASNQEAVFLASLTLTIRAPDDEALARLAHMVEEAAARSLARLLPCTLQMAAGALTTLPLGIDAVAAQRMLPGSALATTYPWLWDELQQPGGRLVGVKLRGGSPVVLDTFDEERFQNANIGVFGHSGAGKTYLVKSLLRADLEAGMAAFIIDPESEYRDLCDAAGGQWVELALGSGHSLNVMDPALAVSDERDPLGDQASDLIDLLATMCGSVSDDERVELDETLRAVLPGGGATLATLRVELGRRGAAPRVARSLRRWTEGPLGDLFSAPTNVRFDAPLTAFALRDLKEELLPMAYFLIAQWIWARVRAERRPRRLLFDEVGLMFEYPVVRRFLVRLARRVRKYQGSLCLVTQNAGDLLSSEQGVVLATNPAVTFVGAQRPGEAQRLQRALALTDGQVAFLGRARRGEFLLLAGESRHRIRVVAPPG